MLHRRIRIAAVALLASIGLAVSASPALAHWPDWWASYNITSNRASAYAYDSSSTYGSHSRGFVHRKSVPGGYCNRYQKIGDNYYVWDDFTICFY